MTKCEAAAAAGLAFPHREPDAAADPEGGRKHEARHRAHRTHADVRRQRPVGRHAHERLPHRLGRRQENGRDPARVRGEPPGGKKRRRDDKAQ